jgi:hypothetical protein
MSIISNLVMGQGTDFLASWNIVDANNNPINLTLFPIESSMKRFYTSNSSYTWSFTCNGYANGYLTISLPFSNVVTISQNNYVYDVLIRDSGNNVVRLIEGVIAVSPTSTIFV